MQTKYIKEHSLLKPQAGLVWRHYWCLMLGIVSEWWVVWSYVVTLTVSLP